LKQRSLLRLLLIPFLERARGYERVANDQITRFKDVIDYIEANYMRPVTVSELADMIHLQCTYFSNLFTATFGMSPKHYMIQVRIFRAQYLLEFTDRSVAEIGAGVGYEDPLYFSRVFSRFVGMSPRQYRTNRHAMLTASGERK
jgi:AraC-like DNA-binding protein